MSKALAIKYRPKCWEDVTEQSSTKLILQQQLDSGEVKNAYLFCGPAGCGKTTCARIFANDINKGQGNPIELDAASNNGVDDVRNIIQQAQTQSLNSEYKIFIIDECHALSNSAWQAMLKIIEEPPAKSIFIFCTTDPQKIPKTILSRVQRYDFQRISQQGIVSRIEYVLHCEMADFDNFSDFTFTEDFAGNWKSGDVVNCEKKSDGILVDGVALIGSNELLKHGHFNLSIRYDHEALEYIAKIADGGMRDAITLMDKCLAYSKDLTLKNVVKALGTTDYDTMFKLTDCLIFNQPKEAVKIIENIFNDGKDLKTFVRQYVQFLLDLSKYGIGCEWKYLQLPKLESYEKWLKECDNITFDVIQRWLSVFVNLNADIKWSQSVKYDIEAQIVLECMEI